jgi:hypothetical protein
VEIVRANGYPPPVNCPWTWGKRVFILPVLLAAFDLEVINRSFKRLAPKVRESGKWSTERRRGYR